MIHLVGDTVESIRQKSKNQLEQMGEINPGGNDCLLGRVMAGQTAPKRTPLQK